MIQLWATWHMVRQRPELDALWATLLRRFSCLAVGAVVLLLTAGLVLAWSYVGTWQGLIGTGYGTLVLAKTGLLAVALGFGARNFWTARRWRRGGAAMRVRTQVPAFLEAELAVLALMMFAAAALSSQPLCG